MMHSSSEHDHSHSHSPKSPELRVTFSDHQDCHDHDHEHSHSHSHSHSQGLAHSHSAVNGLNHSYTHSPVHSPEQSPISPHTHSHALEHAVEEHEHGAHYSFPTVTSTNHLHTSPDHYDSVPASAPPTMTRHTRAISLQLPSDGSPQHSSLHASAMPTSQSYNPQMFSHPPPREHQNRHTRNVSLAPVPSTSTGTHFLLPPSPDASASSPLTPSYQFGHDSHFAAHHHAAHVPNLHDHSHNHGHGHEGHSHNMRGVFLHVMAVRRIY